MTRPTSNHGCLKTLGVVAVLWVLGLVAATLFGGEDEEREPARVPDLAWMRLSEAQQSLQSVGLDVSSSDVLEDRGQYDNNNWIVVTQNPTAGTVTTSDVEVGVIHVAEDVASRPDGVRLRPQQGMRLPYVVQVDRQQVEAYAVASSEEADFALEAERCAARLMRAMRPELLDGFAEVYCWVFRNAAAYERANVYNGGSMEHICWASQAGTAQAGAPDPPEPVGQLNGFDILVLGGCP